MFDPKTRILVVDDMAIVRKVAARSLNELGFSDVTTANDGAKAWEAMTNAVPQIGLVLSDWNMPNSNGLSLLKRVRADSRYSRTPFILITAEAEMRQIKEAIQAGVNDYMVKPFTADTLRAKLESVFKKTAA